MTIFISYRLEHTMLDVYCITNQYTLTSSLFSLSLPLSGVNRNERVRYLWMKMFRMITSKSSISRSRLGNHVVTCLNVWKWKSTREDTLTVGTMIITMMRRSVRGNQREREREKRRNKSIRVYMQTNHRLSFVMLLIIACLTQRGGRIRLLNKNNNHLWRIKQYLSTVLSFSSVHSTSMY